MACNHPYLAFWTGCYTENGKKELVICQDSEGPRLNVKVASKRGFRISPNAPMEKDGSEVFLIDPIPIPCGVCVGCRMKRARDWKVRLCKEAEDYIDKTWFITLTYRDDCLPINENGEPYLKKADFQYFMKNMRGFGTIRKYRYFACGEYGDDELTGRPHFHCILFGELDDLLPYAFGKYHSSLVYKSWPFGLHEVQRAELNHMAYVAGYVEKKQLDLDSDRHPVKPFLMMSTKPMIGYRCVPKIDYPDVQVYGNFGNVHSSAAPKAFLKKLEDKDWYEDFKKDMEIKSKKSIEVQNCVFGSSNPTIRGFRKDGKDSSSLEDKRRKSL